MKALITRKIGMSSVVGSDGELLGVTLLSVKDNTITDVKTNEKHGYQAVQLGFETAKRLSKPLMGQFKKAKVLPKIVREFHTNEDVSELKIGDKIEIDTFSVGDKVDVTGLSKGKGFAGTIKRHNFHRGRKTHGGQSYRRPGSIGSMYPQKIFKGKKMAGHVGHNQVTVKNLQVAIVDKENNVIGVIGAIPGPRKGIVLLKEASK
ncbi:50S ribosomal protein L3 [Candidatus Saccharibacteria bacterium]|nr:50S ribosomal protein L3 [Candidatus Saccharibacteria bacterium]